ncbi:MAG: propanediol utilization protein [Pseudomonadota bacterium]
MARQSGHFGEFLQGRLGQDGPVALVTAPCPRAEVQAAWRPGGTFSAYAPGLRLPRGALRHLFRDAGLDAPHGLLRVACTQPPGSGCGVSTASLLAIRATLGPPGAAEDIIALLARIEGATDPLMMPGPETHLWASRRGKSLRRLPPLPRFDVVGGFLGPAELTDPADHRFADISDLVAAWAPAAARGDAQALAELATASALRNRALRGGPALAPVLRAARALGALGLLAAHTGSAVGLLFARGGVPEDAAKALRTLGLRRILRFATGGRP